MGLPCSPYLPRSVLRSSQKIRTQLRRSAVLRLLCCPLRALRADQSPARTCEGPAETKFWKGAAGFSRALCATPPRPRTELRRGGEKGAHRAREKVQSRSALFGDVCVWTTHTHKKLLRLPRIASKVFYIFVSQKFSIFLSW